MERSRPVPERESDEVRVDGSPTRCPFCHEGIAVADEAWVACAGCLARHHAACWDEAPRCGTCGGGERLTRDAAAPRPSPVRPGRALVPRDRTETIKRGLGATRGVNIRHTFEGTADLTELLPWFDATIRRHMKVPGQLEHVGTRIRWTANQEANCISGRIQISVGGGHTSIDVQFQWGAVLAAYLGGLGGGLGIGGGATILAALQSVLPQAVYLPLAILWLPFTVLLAAFLFRVYARKKVRELNALADLLAQGLPGPEELVKPDPKKEA